MPTKIYAPNSGNPSTSDWQSPTSISIYNAGWNTVKVAYVYNLGVWKVVYPDPIFASINILSTFAGRDIDNLIAIGTSLNITNGNNDAIYAELFSGSTPSGTPIATENVNPQSISNGISYYEAVFYSASFADGTYCIRITATSITENISILSTGGILLALLTVSITALYYDSLLDSIVLQWSSTNQYRWRLSATNNSGGFNWDYLNNDWIVSSQTSLFISPNELSGSTSYTFLLEVRSSTFDTAQDSEMLTTPPREVAEITFTGSNSLCQSINISWTDVYTSSGRISLYTYVYDTQLNQIVYTEFKFIEFTTQQSHTFTGLNVGTDYFISGYGRNSQNVQGPVASLGFISTLSAAAPSPPTNVQATSSYWGNTATVSWTQSATNCTPVTAYTLQYKLSTTTTWTTASTSISSSSTSYSLSVLSNRTYNFRILAQSAYGPSGYASSNDLLTNNNPYSISMTAPATTVNTFTSTTISATIKNANGETILTSGIPITWSYAANLLIPASNASISPTSSSTNSSGVATSTFSAGNDDGLGTITTTTSGLSSNGSLGMIVNLTPGLTPTLATARTNFGYDVTHSNYNSLYGYTGSVTNGGSNFDGVWADGFYTIIIPPINTAFPVASRNALISVSCTPGTWTAQPSATTTVTSSRTGYADASASVSNTPTGTLSFSYTWYFGNGTAVPDGTGQTISITSSMRGRSVYCIVKATRTGGVQGFQAQSASIPIPA